VKLNQPIDPDALAARKAFEKHYGLNLAQMQGYYGRENRDLDPVWLGWEACWKYFAWYLK
jgi:hypothetical protein